MKMEIFIELLTEGVSAGRWQWMIREATPGTSFTTVAGGYACSFTECLADAMVMAGKVGGL